MWKLKFDLRSHDCRMGEQDLNLGNAAPELRFLAPHTLLLAR
jgi:hypothetical protein